MLLHEHVPDKRTATQAVTPPFIGSANESTHPVCFDDRTDQKRMSTKAGYALLCVGMLIHAASWFFYAKYCYTPCCMMFRKKDSSDEQDPCNKEAINT
jgi:hypothetical protein